MYVVLGGGVGGSRFLAGMAKVCDPSLLTSVINTGDDYHLYGLHISPDIDINMYALAGVINPTQGWGFSDETFRCQNALAKYYGYENWFQLGDKDLATHIHRTFLLSQGCTLAEVTEQLRVQWEIPFPILPMSNDPVATHILTPDGLVHFQEYLIKGRMESPVLGIEYVGAKSAEPVPGLLDAIESAEGIIIAPSNPLVSIEPILQINGVREAIRRSAGKVLAISPIVGGRVIKGPLAHMFDAFNLEVSPVGIAKYYGALLDALVVDEADAQYREIIQSNGCECFVTNTIMDSDERQRALASYVLRLVTK